MLKLQDLTKPEKLLLYRKRKKLTQREMAKEFGCSFKEYMFWESGGIAIPDYISISNLQPHEKCFIYRRRAGTPQKVVAKELGRCRHWVRYMENGTAPVDELLWYWEH